MYYANHKQHLALYTKTWINPSLCTTISWVHRCINNLGTKIYSPLFQSMYHPLITIVFLPKAKENKTVQCLNLRIKFYIYIYNVADACILSVDSYLLVFYRDILYIS